MHQVTKYILYLLVYVLFCFELRLIAGYYIEETSDSLLVLVAYFWASYFFGIFRDRYKNDRTYMMKSVVVLSILFVFIVGDVFGVTYMRFATQKAMVIYLDATLSFIFVLYEIGVATPTFFENNSKKDDTSPV